MQDMQPTLLVGAMIVVCNEIAGVLPPPAFIVACETDCGKKRNLQAAMFTDVLIYLLC